MEWTSLNETLQSGIELLCRAFQYAVESDVDAWQFAVEWKELQRSGLASCDIRCLIAQGWVKHAVEVERPGEVRRFRQATGNELRERSCFILAERAYAALNPPPNARGDPPQTLPAAEGDAERNGRAIPTATATDGVEAFEDDGDQPEWDPERKELRIGETVIKRFKWPAANQELILAVFEEEGWPPRIDDPLPSVPEQDPKRRLHDTVKCLNRNQRPKRIQFRGDGTGEGVVWETVSEKRRSRPREVPDE